MQKGNEGAGSATPGSGKHLLNALAFGGALYGMFRDLNNNKQSCITVTKNETGATSVRVHGFR